MTKNSKSYSAAGEVGSFREDRTLWKKFKILMRKSPITARIGLLVILFYAVLALFAPYIAPYGEAEVFPIPYAPWSSDFIFGARVSLSAPSAPTVLINEVLPSTDGSGFVEFYNPTNETINLGSWYISDRPSNLTKRRIPGNLSIGPGQLASVGYSESSLGVSSTTTIYLTKPDGTTVANAVSTQMPLDGRSLGRKPAGGGSWFLFTSPTRGQINESSSSLGKNLKINEIHFSEEGNVDWIELHNMGNVPVSTEGLWITSTDDFSDKIELGKAIEAKNFASWDTDFNFSGKRFKLFVIDSSDNVLDACSVDQKNGADYVAAYPDGSGDFFLSGSGTRDSNNDPVRNTSIVINELMVEPPSGERDGEFIELYNKSNSSVNLSAWAFESGVDYNFPGGTVVPAKGYIVIAANPSLTSSAFPNATVIGPYSGNLANGGELFKKGSAEPNVKGEDDDVIDQNKVVTSIKEFLSSIGEQTNFAVISKGDTVSIESIRGKTIERDQKSSSGLFSCPHCGHVTQYEVVHNTHMKIHYL